MTEFKQITKEEIEKFRNEIDTYGEERFECINGLEILDALEAAYSEIDRLNELLILASYTIDHKTIQFGFLVRNLWSD